MSDSISALEQMLRATSARHGVLSSNIANVDTPDYKGKDVVFEQALDSEIALAATSPDHLTPPGASGSGSSEVQVTETAPWVDGNTVELDQEVAKMTENAMLYQAGISLLSTRIKMFKNALRTR
jgi:flagellar basal-body rod protein FlgB